MADAEGRNQQKARSGIRSALRTAATISEALPYLQTFAGKAFVVKYGGHAMGDPGLARSVASDVVLLKQVGINPVVVHGGGPRIGEMLARLRIESEFVDGLRVTGRDAVEVVEMVLAGGINKEVVSAINRAGGTAVGISGKDGGLIRARKLERRRETDSAIEKVVDLGFVGEPEEIDARVLEVLSGSHMIPVVAPLGVGADGLTYNINADTAAGAIAGAVGAARLLMLTDVAGVLDADGALVSEIGASAARAMIRAGTISGGMIPKVETCLEAVGRGVEAAVIMDGRIPHGLLLEVFTELGVGTMIRGAEGA